MKMVTLKQYADEKGISYEAVRKQTIKFADELADHIVVVDGTRYLDEEAQKFLSERRRLSPIVVKIEDTQADNEERSQEIETLKTALLQMQKRVIELQDEARGALEDRIKYQLLLSDHEKQEKRLQDAENTISMKEKALQDEIVKRQDVERQLQDAKKEAESYEKSWFGFYRKRL